MTKKAFCVGVNNYPLTRGAPAGSDGDIDLKGCVNDAHLWADLLIDQFDFAKDDVHLLLDHKATKSAIMSGLKSLLAGARADDVLVYSFSGHGTYVADQSADEPFYDQAQCPFDWEDNLLIDDDLRELFIALPKGVRLTVISDSCHSGTVTRLADDALIDKYEVTRVSDDELSPTNGISRARSLSPALFGGTTLTEIELEDLVEDTLGFSGGLFDPKYPEAEMNEILLSGCNQMEYSRDMPFGDKYHGAMSFYAYNVMKRHKYRITYREMHREVLHWLNKFNITQTPQLEGHDDFKDRQVFS